MEDAPLQLDCSQLSPRELAEQLRAQGTERPIDLVGLDTQPPLSGLCSGVTGPLTIQALGNVGDFCCLLGAEATVDIRGQAGDCVGHSLLSGQIIVHGTAGRCVAAYAQGGFVAVLGQAGVGCGLGLNGGDVLIRSRAGDYAGMHMRNGTLILGNGAGDELGAGMTGGVIYVRGEVKSKSADIRLERIKDADAMRLSLLMARAGIKANTAEFKVFRAKGPAA